MDINQSIQISQLSVPERIQLVEDLWDDIASHPEVIPLPDWQKAELDRRKTNFQNNPQKASQWEDIKKRIQG